MTFDGVYTPIVTPFAADESIDYDKVRHNLSRLSASELVGIIVLGSNGEFPYLSRTEKLELVRFVREHWSPERKFIVGTGCESTKDTVELTAEVSSFGVDGVLVLPPHYYTRAMNEAVLFEHFQTVADNSPVPVLLYNMPPNTGINLSADLVAKLSQHENIVGIKDTAGSIVQLSEIIRSCGDGFSVLAGSVGLMLPALAVGATGAVAALGNALPDDCCRLYRMFRDGQMDEARNLQLRLLEINSAVTTRFGVPGLKAAMDLLGFQGGSPRRPLIPLSAESQAEINSILVRHGALGD